MTIEDGAAAFAAWWVRRYTARVGAEAAEGRRAEITSDVWEQRAHATDIGAAPSAVAVSIAWRVVGGVPADLVWVRQQRVVSRGRPPEREVRMSRFHRWWLVAAGAVAAFYVWVLLGNLNDAEGPHLGGSVVCVLGAAAICAGVVLRQRGRRAAGDVLVAAGAAPALVVVWFWPALVTALVVVLCALADLAGTRTLRSGAPGPDARHP